jgi:hypothetical protein
MPYIELSKYGKNRGIYKTEVDEIDFEYFNQFNWSYFKPKHQISSYAVRNIYKNGKRITSCLHREIALRAGIINQNQYENSKEIEIDHIYNNGLNNKRDNLRIASRKGNNLNRNKFRTKNGITPSSRYKYVSFHKQKGKWQAKVWIGGKAKHLGYFLSEEAAYEAAVAYIKANPNLNNEFRVF